MLEHLPEDIRRGLEEARRHDTRRGNRLNLQVGGQAIPLNRLWEDGFALDAGRAPGLRGLVDIYDGAQHLSQCLIVASALEGDEMVYEFKRTTVATARPVRDYADETLPAAGFLPSPI
ncbi:MAG: hypothetical protein ACXIVG_03560 [Pararhodobacter sp.]